MKLIRYYGKRRNFNSIECVQKTGKFRQEKLLFIQFMQRSLYNDCLVIALQFIPSQCFNYGKLLSSYVEHRVVIDQTHSKGKSLQQNMVLFY